MTILNLGTTELTLTQLIRNFQFRFRDMFQQELKSGQVFGDFSAFSTEYSKAIKIIGHF